ncbi:MAG: zinc ribbon domain-containing protein [Deltaproteobacteria bacterium]|nr:zinc ribbon domain-containing protein [Deltaproteobacteria bacterium]MBW2018717.1 zinc ribbon domain-containing protein [Deltaproteobacteria bacterium]MBW2073446.1 zinc ribbon domain-containing protein [Deltaproteobacteria bacterium]RLB83045.1 MAG: zinc ribbon domain-containing protein [Deltaproteobacteria bacterium]
MPLYEFRCAKCGHEFEQIVFSSDKRPMACPKCGAPKPERLLSIFSSSTSATRPGTSVSSSCVTSSRGFS